MTSFLYSQNSFNPSNHFVGGRVGRFVEVDDPVSNVLLKRSLQRRATSRNRSVMPSANMQFVIVLDS